MIGVTNAIFYALFLNTGFMLLLTNADLSEKSDYLSFFFRGKYNDYSPRWYASIGSTLTGTLLLMPMIVIGAECWQITKWCYNHYKDNNFNFSVPKSERMFLTKTSQIQRYQEIHTGPVHKVDEKLSNILNITFVTLMYGMGLPILFPIAFLYLFTLYTLERFQIAYFYQMPPAMDDRMTKNALEKLSRAPLIFLLNGYWMLSNRQMFENVVSKVDFSTD